MLLFTFIDRKENVSLDRIEEHSIKLANDIYICHHRFINNKMKWKKSEATFASGIRIFLAKFETILGLLTPPVLKSLLMNGLSALDDDSVWCELEYVALKISPYGKVINNNVLYLARLYNDDLELQPPSKFDIKGYITDISNLNKASLLLFTQYREFLIFINKSDKSQMYLRNLKHSTYGTLIKLIQNDKYRDLLGLYGLKAFAVNRKLLNAAKECPKYMSVHFQLMLSNFDNKIFERKSILIKGRHRVDLTDLYDMSPALYKDIQRYSNVIDSTFLHLKDDTIRDRFSAFKRVLPILQSVLPREYNSLLLTEGIGALIFNDGLLKQLHDKNALSRKDFLLIHGICQCVYPEKTPELISFRENQLSFPGINRNRDLQCDFSIIKVISERMYDDFSEFLEQRKQDIDQKNYSMVSVHHNYQQVKSLIHKYRDSFTQQHINILREWGIKGFGVDDGLVQKHLLAELQVSVNENSFNRKTAITYRSSLAWLVREFGVPFNDIYPIKYTKTVKHNQRLNAHDFYTESQCRELAFYIEKLLCDYSESLYHKILLNFGKVILKTAWNISPLLKLECEDIVEVESPITNKTEYAVVLHKARAGHRSDTYTFNKSDLKPDTLKSAIADLLTVRDDLTKDLRSQTENNNFVFIYPRNGEIRKLEYSSVKYLSQMLKSAGCKVPFSAQKIRKGGVNHIYRKVQKNIKNYTDTVQHSFEVFESNYLRINPDQSRYSLNQATKVMADYFTGKEISSDIHIITDISANQYQVVPTGACAAKANNREAKRYDREHRKLHQSKNHESKLCADFLSCIWCRYFRVVVDAEHIWKLLSYKDYILQSMKMSIVDFDDSDHQITNINILEQRVDDIIFHLRGRDTKAVEDGFILLEQHGMHVDWEFACPSIPMIKGEL